jgi:hypothetical protein
MQRYQIGMAMKSFSWRGMKSFIFDIEQSKEKSVVTYKKMREIKKLTPPNKLMRRE